MYTSVTYTAISVWTSGSSGTGTVARHQSRRTNSPLDTSSAMRMSSSSNGIDGAGPAGPVCGSMLGWVGIVERVTMFGTCRVGGQRYGRRGQQPPVLTGVDAAGGRRPAVENPRDRVLDGFGGVAAAQELQMHVGRQPSRIDGAAGGGQALRGELPAERALAGRAVAVPDPGVGGAARLQVEQFEQRAHPRGTSTEAGCHRS